MAYPPSVAGIHLAGNRIRRIIQICSYSASGTPHAIRVNVRYPYAVRRQYPLRRHG